MKVSSFICNTFIISNVFFSRDWQVKGFHIIISVCQYWFSPSQRNIFIGSLQSYLVGLILFFLLETLGILSHTKWKIILHPPDGTSVKSRLWWNWWVTKVNCVSLLDIWIVTFHMYIGKYDATNHVHLYLSICPLQSDK